MSGSARMLFVEGGGDRNPALASECRRAFSKLFEAAQVRRRPRVVACGGRTSAFEQFRLAVTEGKVKAWLLVDSEDVVAEDYRARPWLHVRRRMGDQWEQPAGAGDDQIHLMVACMETWLCIDRDALRSTLGPSFDESRLPPGDESLEGLSKDRIYAALKGATRSKSAKAYDKGAHSFKALSRLRPERLEVLWWGKRFLAAMRHS